MLDIGNPRPWLAGWPLRNFSLAEFAEVLSSSRQGVVEISKDFLGAGVSLKSLEREISHLRGTSDLRVAFAATTDLVRCAGMPWSRYRAYIAVQIAQARFLDCSLFRFFVGKAVADVPIRSVVDRIDALCLDLAPMRPCMEIHGGIECDLPSLSEILKATPVAVVVDLENMYRAGLTTDQLRATVPLDRIAYFHYRNLPPHWIEHAQSLEDERRWREIAPDAPFLWEPKTVDDPTCIRELLRGH